jgi:hypothetical protein
MRTGVRHHCCSAYLTFVSLRTRSHGPGQAAKREVREHSSSVGAQACGDALDAPLGLAPPHERMSRRLPPAPSLRGRPCPCRQQALPRIVPSGPEQQSIYEQADGRRQERLSRRLSLAGDPRRAEEVEKARLRPVTHRRARGRSALAETFDAWMPGAWPLLCPIRKALALTAACLSQCCCAPQGGLPNAASAGHAAAARRRQQRLGSLWARQAARVSGRHDGLHDAEHHAAARQHPGHHLRRPGAPGPGSPIPSDPPGGASTSRPPRT